MSAAISTRQVASSPRQNSARSLLDLPTEVIEEIVASADEPAMRALFRTCKLLYVLACPHVFKTLRASRTVGRHARTYRRYILPNHLRHFTHLAFDSGDETALESLVDALASLTRLDELTFGSGLAAKVFGHFDKRRSIDMEDAFRLLQRLAPSVRVLWLEEQRFSPESVTSCLELFPALRVLHFRGKLPASMPTRNRFVKALKGLDNLSLKVENIPKGFVDSSLEWPALTCLDIEAENEEEVGAFIHLFRCSLVRLSVDIGDEDDCCPFGTRKPWSFPLLERLDLAHSSDLAHHFLAEAIAPKLRHLCLRYEWLPGNGFEAGDWIVDGYLNDYKLETLEYDVFDRVWPRMRKSLDEFAERNPDTRVTIQGENLSDVEPEVDSEAEADVDDQP